MPMNSREVLKLLTKDAGMRYRRKGLISSSSTRPSLAASPCLRTGATFPLVRSTVFSNKLA